ncbi:hypothetical protein [Mycolicibacterium helvum]|uniref:hypothetical protein n=1 Tax=Mycolicibacterium helvum TaxID=1534349 RepID=UPI001FE88888|nr:hypothetical protein [Mycolicibacterium helvum]
MLETPALLQSGAAEAIGAASVAAAKPPTSQPAHIAAAFRLGAILLNITITSFFCLSPILQPNVPIGLCGKTPFRERDSRRL